MRSPDSPFVLNALKGNSWQYDSKVQVITYPIPDTMANYEVDLECMWDSHSILDWISQVSKKTWATSECVGDMVSLLDAILDFQGKYCGGGMLGPTKEAQR